MLWPKHKIFTYIIFWLVYAIFTLLAFPAFNKTVFLFSIALSMVGAWLYGYIGGLITTALTIPFHYIVLSHFSDSLEARLIAFNAFGITVQICLSTATAFLRSTKEKLECLNHELESKIKERTEELDRLQNYIIQNHETAQIMLSRMLLGDLADSLSEMLQQTDDLRKSLALKGSPASDRAACFYDMINNCVSAVKNLEFVDHFFTDKHAGFANAVREVAAHFEQSANVEFDLNFHVEHTKIAQHTQHQLYRITREAVTNAVRHARAKKILIHLRVTHDSYELQVINDGHPLPDNIEMGLGMKLILHRSQQLGGKVEWEKTKESRTCFHCSIPKASI